VSFSNGMKKIKEMTLKGKKKVITRDSRGISGKN